MSSGGANEEKKETAFSVFATVDKAVSKTVFGSDGAANWQSFQASNSALSSKKTSSVAPTAPLKRSDRASGITSWEQERSVEKKNRNESGSAPMNAGYTNFAEKPMDPSQRKETKRIEERKIRPNQQYFIPSVTFTGWKWDYVFTTKEQRGTGYYFDGMDSLKELRGELQRPLETTKATTTVSEKSGDEPTSDRPKKKKRKKESPVILSDPTNPREQVMVGLTARMQQQTTGDLPPDWESAVDPTSKKTYYFHRTSGQRTWEKPTASNKWKQVETKDEATGKVKVYYYNETTRETRWDKPEGLLDS